MENIKDILNQAHKIGKTALFRVKIYSNDDNDTKEVKTLTYIELGTLLITNSHTIEQIDILMKPE